MKVYVECAVMCRMALVALERESFLIRRHIKLRGEKWRTSSKLGKTAWRSAIVTRRLKQAARAQARRLPATTRRTMRAPSRRESVRTIQRWADAWKTFFKARSQNCEKRLLASSHLSVCLSVRLDIWPFFENVSKNYRVWLNPTRITGTWHEDIFAFVTISRWILPWMIDVSNTRYRENQNTHFMFSTPFPKIVPFMR